VVQFEKEGRKFKMTTQSAKLLATKPNKPGKYKNLEKRNKQANRTIGILSI